MTRHERTSLTRTSLVKQSSMVSSNRFRNTECHWKVKRSRKVVKHSWSMHPISRWIRCECGAIPRVLSKAGAEPRHYWKQPSTHSRILEALIRRRIIQTDRVEIFQRAEQSALQEVRMALECWMNDWKLEKQQLQLKQHQVEDSGNDTAIWKSNLLRQYSSIPLGFPGIISQLESVDEDLFILVGQHREGMLKLLFEWMRISCFWFQSPLQKSVGLSWNFFTLSLVGQSYLHT